MSRRDPKMERLLRLAADGDLDALEALLELAERRGITVADDSFAHDIFRILEALNLTGLADTDGAPEDEETTTNAERKRSE